MGDGFKVGVAVCALAGCGPTVDTPIDTEGGEGSSGSTSGGTSNPPQTSTGSPTLGSSEDSGSDVSSSGGVETTGGTTTSGPFPRLCLEHGYPGLNASEAFRVADVDGDGVDEFWRLSNITKPEILPGARGYRVSGLEVDEEPAASPSFEADRVEMADIDGDGRDDILRSWMGALEVRYGQADLTFTEPFEAVPFPPGPVPRLFVDVDGDGDDDAIRQVDMDVGTNVELLRNDGGTFIYDSGAVVVGVGLPEILIVNAIDDQWIVLQTADEVWLLSRGQRLSVLGSFDSPVRYVGGASTPQGPIAFVIDGEDVQTVAFVDGALERTPFASGVSNRGAAVGDFEGLGAPQLLYRTETQLWLKRYPDGSEFEVGFDPEQQTQALPWSPGSFEGGVGVLARACGFTCEFIPARLVEC